MTEDQASRIEVQPTPETRTPQEPPEVQRSFLTDLAANGEQVITSVGQIVAGGLILEMIKGGRGSPPPDAGQDAPSGS